MTIQSIRAQFLYREPPMPLLQTFLDIEVKEYIISASLSINDVIQLVNKFIGLFRFELD